MRFVLVLWQIVGGYVSIFLHKLQQHAGLIGLVYLILELA